MKSILSRLERAERIDELERELIELKVVNQYELGYIICNCNEEQLLRLTEIAILIKDETGNPIGEADEIMLGKRLLSPKGIEKIDEIMKSKLSERNQIGSITARPPTKRRWEYEK